MAEHFHHTDSPYSDHLEENHIVRDEHNKMQSTQLRIMSLAHRHHSRIP